MLIEDVRKLDPIARFTYWITERESIRLKKEAGESKPFTDDKILQSYRFCNVVRIEDKVSQWLLRNWFQPYFDHPNMIPAIALARHFNKPSSLEAIGFPVVWNSERMKKVLREIMAKGNTVFNAAYVVRGNDGEDKIESVIDHTVQPLVDQPIKVYMSMEKTWQALCEYRGLGSFMAGQIVADMRWAMKGGWVDRMTWAPLGPGSTRGMNRLHNRPIEKSMKQDQFSKELQALIKVCKEKLPKPITDRMEAMDFQNCCCEYDKFCRVLDGVGKPKQRYNGYA